MRVWEIATVAGVPSKDARDYLKMLGINVKSVSSRVDEPLLVQAVIARLIATRNDFARSYLLPPF